LLVPLLCQKIGLNNAILKQQAKDLIQKCFTIYDHKKCVVLMIRFGVGAKNLKSVSESLDCLAFFVRFHGVD
jgi:S-adenosylmethionine synthetase